MGAGDEEKARRKEKRGMKRCRDVDDAGQREDAAARAISAASAQAGSEAEEERRLLKMERKAAKRARREKARLEVEASEEGSGSTGSDKREGSRLPPHSKILAPMVGGSELAFRLLCRRYGVDLAYTPMMSSERFAADSEYRRQEFQTTPEDRPLVAHFSANNPQHLLAAARWVEHSCDAIDLNLGCPQRIAHAGHFGSYLLGQEDRDLVISIVKTAAENLSIPVFVKIRLLDSVSETIELCQQLADAGAALIAIHARYRVNLVGRSGPGARDGAAMLEQIAPVRAALLGYVNKTTGQRVRIVANGNVRTAADVEANREYTGADGIMSAEGILDNPAIFSGDDAPDKLSLASEYLALVARYPVKLRSLIFHLRRLCRDELAHYQLTDELVSAESQEAVQAVVARMLELRSRGRFSPDPDKARRAKEAAERRKADAGKRKAFEERMLRKAKREGLPPDHYLQQGLANPTFAGIRELKLLPDDALRMARWRAAHAQHCFNYHFGSQGCHRERSCSFLHADPEGLGDGFQSFG